MPVCAAIKDLDGEFANFSIGLYDTLKYDITWTENKKLIDRFLPEILTFKECSKRVQHVFDTCWVGHALNTL